MPPTWIPRAATSVATNATFSCSLNSLNVQARIARNFLPCRAPTGTPAFARLSARRSALRWVLTKRIVFPLRAAICAVIKSLSPGCITRTWCSLVETDARSFFSELSLGSLGMT